METIVENETVSFIEGLTIVMDMVIFDRSVEAVDETWKVERVMRNDVNQD
jgi:hypothetical protein